MAPDEVTTSGLGLFEERRELDGETWVPLRQALAALPVASDRGVIDTETLELMRQAKGDAVDCQAIFWNKADNAIGGVGTCEHRAELIQVLETYIEHLKGPGGKTRRAIDLN